MLSEAGRVSQYTSRTVSMEGCASDESTAELAELSGQTQTAPARVRAGNASTDAAELQQADASSACAAHNNH